MKYDNIEELREYIDQCDKKIIELLEGRLDCVAEIARYKFQNQLNIYDSGRENIILDRIGGTIKNRDYLPYLRDVYSGIMNASKNYQKKMIDSLIPGSEKLHPSVDEGMKAAYQGVPGSYGEEALLAYFGENVSSVNYKSFEQVAGAVLLGEADYGILPVENSYTGSVTASLDIFTDNDLFICGEYILPICHNLVAKKGTSLTDIKEVYSHEQGFLQCRDFLEKYPDWKHIEYMNTAISAKMVAESDAGHRAAISSRRAAQIYGLDILAENINQSETNSTRFIVFSKEFMYDPKADKISVVFSLPHRSGTLFEAMRLITRQGLNLLKIESRPYRKTNWEYIFFIDFEGNMEEERCRKAIEDLKEITGTFRLLGNYVKDGSGL